MGMTMRLTSIKLLNCQVALLVLMLITVVKFCAFLHTYLTLARNVSFTLPLSSPHLLSSLQQDSSGLSYAQQGLAGSKA